MSQPTRETSNRLATIWPIVGTDEFGRKTYGTPYLITCTFEQGSSRQYRDAQGVMYIPASIYWYEFDAIIGIPNINDSVALGDNTLESDPNNVDGTELIKNRVREDNSLLGDIDDIMILT